MWKRGPRGLKPECRGLRPVVARQAAAEPRHEPHVCPVPVRLEAMRVCEWAQIEDLGRRAVVPPYPAPRNRLPTYVPPPPLPSLTPAAPHRQAPPSRVGVRTRGNEGGISAFVIRTSRSALLCHAAARKRTRQSATQSLETCGGGRSRGRGDQASTPPHCQEESGDTSPPSRSMASLDVGAAFCNEG